MVLEQLDINVEKHKPREHQKFSSKWIIYITIRPKNIRHLLKSIGQNVCDSGLGKDGGGVPFILEKSTFWISLKFKTSAL